MPFNSLSFILFFSLFLFFYFFFENVKIRKNFLILGSLVFYAYNNFFNLLFLLTTTLVTYVFANKLIHSRKNGTLSISIFIVLLQLIFLKYSDRLFADFFDVLNPRYTYFKFSFPIGISFYSLQAISLLSDIRSGKYDGDTSLKSVSLFLCFFPQSLSGPMHKASELIPQFSIKQEFNAKNIIVGFKTMLWGYFCKLIIADKIALIITPVFISYHEFDGFSISISALLYSFQIYFDFFGYSLIAIGLGRVLGYDININFRNPYSAKSFKDFWHRWHITLSKWMRDYIYIPLGGNKQKHYFLFGTSIFFTFLISGFWHGATLNFILWGAVHAFLYLFEDFFSRYISLGAFRLNNIFIKLAQSFIFFSLVSLTWLIFRTDSLHELTKIIRRVLSISDWTVTKAIDYYGSTTNTLYLIIILLSVLIAQTKFISQLYEIYSGTARQKIGDSIFVCICLTLIILFGDIGVQEFQYFDF